MSLAIERKINIARHSGRLMPIETEKKVAHDFMVKQMTAREVAEKHGIRPQRVCTIAQNWDFKKKKAAPEPEIIPEYSTLMVEERDKEFVLFLLAEHGLNVCEVLESKLNQ